MEKQGEELDQESPLEPEETSQEELDSEEDSLETLRKELDQTKDLLLRKQAEFENYRKRIRKERGEQRLAAQATEDTFWGVYYGICNDLDEAPARALMQELTGAPFVEVASRARESLAEA